MPDPVPTSPAPTAEVPPTAPTTAAPPPATAPVAPRAAPAASPPAQQALALQPGAQPRPAQPRTLRDIANKPPEEQAKKDGLRFARKALKAFGIDVKKGDDIVAKAEEFKRDQDKVRSERKDFRQKAEGLDRASKAMQEAVDAEMASLPAEQQAQVKLHIAGADAVTAFEKIVALKKAGMLKAQGALPETQPPAAPPAVPPPPAAAVPAPAPRAPVSPPATSAPPTPGPVPTSATPPDVKSEIARLEQTGRTSSGPAAKRSLLTASIAKYENKSTLYKDDHRPGH
jgi:hypothetical protein